MRIEEIRQRHASGFGPTLSVIDGLNQQYKDIAELLRVIDAVDQRLLSVMKDGEIATPTFYDLRAILRGEGE